MNSPKKSKKGKNTVKPKSPPTPQKESTNDLKMDFMTAMKKIVSVNPKKLSILLVFYILQL